MFYLSTLIASRCTCAIRSSRFFMGKVRMGISRQDSLSVALLPLAMMVVVDPLHSVNGTQCIALVAVSAVPQHFQGGGGGT
jgi:hypothetical protein